MTFSFASKHCCEWKQYLEDLCMMDIIIHTQADKIAGKIKMGWAGKN